jgi:hypothetical protein
MSTSHVHRITKYDPADRDDRGAYRGSGDVSSDHGPVEAAYLAAVTAFAEDAGVTRLTIRDPAFSGFVHVGYDQYLYIGSAHPCGRAVALTAASGLFVEPLDGSPYDPDGDGPYESRPADAAFWAEAAVLAARHGRVLLEEQIVGNHSRWHRLTADAPVPALGPRALLSVWPDLSADVPAVLRTMSPDFAGWGVVEHADGRIHSFHADGDDRAGLTEALAGVRAAILLPHTTTPLLVAVQPDDDGIVRGRWQI